MLSVNSTLRFYYKYDPINAVQKNKHCTFYEPHEATDNSRGKKFKCC
jgi:hypothetical protein